MALHNKGKCTSINISLPTSPHHNSNCAQQKELGFGPPPRALTDFYHLHGLWACDWLTVTCFFHTARIHFMSQLKKGTHKQVLHLSPPFYVVLHSETRGQSPGPLLRQLQLSSRHLCKKAKIALNKPMQSRDCEYVECSSIRHSSESPMWVLFVTIR